MREQIVVGQVFAVFDVPEKAEAGILRDALVDFGHRLDLGMIGRDAAAHQPVGRGQAVEHVDLDGQVRLFLQVVRQRRMPTDPIQ